MEPLSDGVVGEGSIMGSVANALDVVGEKQGIGSDQDCHFTGLSKNELIAFGRNGKSSSNSTHLAPGRA